MSESKEQTKDSFDFQGNYQKKYENIRNLVQAALNQLEKVQNAIEILESEDRRAHYQSIPGTEGVFDGQYLIAQDGRKTEVPSNYAAKSKLVYGDILKVFTDSGRQIFKQIDRVERKIVEGVLTNNKYEKDGVVNRSSRIMADMVQRVDTSRPKQEVAEDEFEDAPF